MKQDGTMVDLVAEHALTAADIGATELWFVPPDASPGEILAVMDEKGFDVAPVRQDPVWRFIERSRLDELQDGTVLEASNPITTEIVIPARTGLITTIETLGRTPFVFLMDRRGVASIVNHADLQKPAVAIATLSLIFSAERALKQIVETQVGDLWTGYLTKKRLKGAKRIYGKRRRHNTDISLLECVTLDDLFSIIRKKADLVEALGFASRTQLGRWKERLKKARDTLAHAGDLLSAEPDPQKAISLFHDVADFARRAVGVAEQRQ